MTVGRLSMIGGTIGGGSVTIVKGDLVKWTVTFQNTGDVPLDYRIPVWFGHISGEPPWEGAEWIGILMDWDAGEFPKGTINPGEVMTEFQVCDPLRSITILDTLDVLYILQDQHDSLIMYDYVLNPNELTVSGAPIADITSAYLETY